MATFRKRGSSWHVQVRRSGHPPVTRSFKLKADADAWARKLEAEVDRGELPVDRRALRSTTLGDLLTRYRETVTPTKRGNAQEDHRLRKLLAYPISRTALAKLTPAAFAKYRDERLSQVQGVTVRRELAIMRHALEVARKEWDLCLPSNPAGDIKLPMLPKARQRRLGEGELERLLAACGPRRRLLATIVQLAAETALRRGELLNVRWRDVDLPGRTLHVPQTKNGHPRTIPLTPCAIALLKANREEGASVDDRLFPLSPNALRLAWERLVRRAGIADLHFHDLRHEAVSRFFERGLTVPEVALISGHRDFRQLFSYTHLRAADVADKLHGTETRRLAA